MSQAIQTSTQMRHLKMQVQRRLNRCLQQAEQHFGRSFPIPTVNYRLRGAKAGVAYLQQNEIRLNPQLLLENSEAFLHQVIPHELAHLLAYQLFGRVKPHGMEWRQIMTDLFGLPAHTRHQFDIRSVQGNTFSYQCGCQIHQLSVRRHNRIQREGTVYYCRKCKQKLMFIPS